MYLTLDQTQVRDKSRLEELLQVSEGVSANGSNVDMWEAAHSLTTGSVCLTAWWQSLAALEASDTLKRNLSDEDGPSALLESVIQQLMIVVSGPTEFNQTHAYLRILEVSALKDMQAAIDNGIELAEKVSSVTGISMTLLRNVTGFSRNMMFLSTYESLAQYEDAGHHLQATSYWLHHRSQYGNAFDGPTLAMNLFRRIGSSNAAG